MSPTSHAVKRLRRLRRAILFRRSARRLVLQSSPERPLVEPLEQRCLLSAVSCTRPPIYPTGRSPLAMTTGDFNGDGKIDLATANRDANTVSILLGDGTGGLGPKTDFATGTNPQSITAGDFNGDGNPDLAVANNGSNTLSILLGDGSGGFGPKTDFATGRSPSSVAAADFDGDGNLDLALTRSKAVRIRLGDGNGGFCLGIRFATGRSTSSLAVGDFNGDGNLDLAMSNTGSNTVSIRLGDGSGGFGPTASFATGSRPQSVLTGDFNGDGNLDLVTGNYQDSSILLGNGDGGFGLKMDLGIYSLVPSGTPGDFNGDGKLDFAAIYENYQGSSIRLLLGSGDGSFTRDKSFSAGSGDLSTAVGDFNSDGNLDLAVAAEWRNSVSVNLGDGKGMFRPKTDFVTGSRPQSLTTGDFNGDGNLDLATASGDYYSRTPGTVSILLGDGRGGLGPKTDFSIGTGEHSVLTGDFNGDGNLDLAVLNGGTYNYKLNTYEGCSISILLGDGGGGFGPKTDIAIRTGWHSLAPGDFNGDGDLDLAVANSGTYNFKLGKIEGCSVSILLGDGSGGFGQETSFNTAGGSQVKAADLNGDGNLDLAVANTGTSSSTFPGLEGCTVSVLLGEGSGGFGPYTESGSDPSTGVVTVGDFNGDGKLDLASAFPSHYLIDTGSHHTGSVGILLGDGTGRFGPKTTTSKDVWLPNSMTAGDFNDDGRLDLATATFVCGPWGLYSYVTVFPGNGSKKFDINGGAGCVTAADFNGDGKLDLAVANSYSNTVTVLLNTTP